MYYLLPSVLGICAAYELARSHHQSDVPYFKLISYSFWFIAAGMFFLCSAYAVWKRSKHLAIFIALAITNAVMIAYGEFNWWLAARAFSGFLEPLVTGIVMAAILCWWLLTGLRMGRVPQVGEEAAIASNRQQTDRAFQCFVSLVFLQLVLVCLARMFLFGHRSQQSALELLAMYFWSYLVLLIVTILFSGPTNLSRLRDRFGLRRPALSAALISTVTGVAMATLAMAITRHSSVADAAASKFLVFGKVGVKNLIVLALSTPFFEEPIIRGYLYPAIRRTYSTYVSILLVVASLFISHGAVMFGSLTGGWAVIGANVVICLIREKTDSLWNCILCHFAYNLVLVGSFTIGFNLG